MPFVPRKQVLEALRDFWPREAGEAELATLLAACGLKDKPLYRPEEVSALGRAMMARAQQGLAAATQV